MTWNWEEPDWPKFTFDSKVLVPFESRFLVKSGEFLGAFKHVGQDDRDMFKIELISDEAVKTSEIEGEVLRRDSVQCSLREQFGLGTDGTNVNAAEHGIAEMMVDLYERFAEPLTHDKLFEWHKMLMSGDRQIQVIGGYRTHPEAMQVVTPIAGKPKVHFVARPYARRHRTSVLRVHSPVRRWQWPHRARYSGKIVGRKSRAADAHCACLHDRAQAAALLRSFGAQQQ